MTNSPVRFASQTEIANWNKHLANNPNGGSIFETYEYANIKKLTNYRPVFLFIGELAVTVLEKKASPLGVFWYLPKGPGVTSASDLITALELLRPFAKKQAVFMIRIETELPKEQSSKLQDHGLVLAKPVIPNSSTILLDITKPADDLLLSLPQKGRHAIRRAQKDGVTVQQVPANDQNSKKMYALLTETAQGQFGIRSFNYYKTYWQSFESAGMGQLFFAYYKGDVVAGAYAMVFGAKSTYKDGASIRQRTAYGASHLLQWHVITWAQQQGATIHDFCGSPPSDQIENPEHPHYGIGRFKLSFSRHVVDYIGCYDFIVAPLRYKAWQKGLERIHKHFYLKRTGDFYY